MNIKVYRLIFFIFSPLIFVYMLWRKFSGKEDKNRFLERFGKTNVERPNGKLIWFNAVSVGEINSAWSIIKRLNENENYNILITTTSVTSAENVKNKIENLPNKSKVIHQFIPIDMTCCVKKFLEHWRPNILVGIESEFWPNLFLMAKQFCSIIVLNGKISKKSFRFWYKFKKLKESIFDSIDICLAQSRNDYKRFINLGVQNVQFIGNIKFLVDKCSVDDDLYNHLKEKIKGRKSWLVNCTHDGEEGIILETHKLLKRKYDNLLTMLIIRHPNRIETVKKIMNKNNIRYVTASSNEELENDVELYIYDKFGNLGTFFELNNVVFMAGSLQKGIGGHTPAEAIKHNCCVVTGPYVENNYMLYKDLLNDDACILLKDNKAATLFNIVDCLFSDDLKTKNIMDNAFRKSLHNGVLLNQVIDIIESKL
ncbi:MAG: 3-deoxy-D-manno-octulosonic acid transferase [Rickettsiales bacterium]|nr:3-deoxy-D-manno-octulosonic acid transferase [Rickettsiales bacterium]